MIENSVYKRSVVEKGIHGRYRVLVLHNCLKTITENLCCGKLKHCYLEVLGGTWLPSAQGINITK